jgi:hypothetical protein
MILGIFDILYPSLKTRVLIDEIIFDMNRSDMNSEKYLIPIHRKNLWTNKYMQDLRNNLLHIRYHDPSTQYKKG